MIETVTLQRIIDNRGALLAELHRRQAIVRDYARGVARQYATGLYLFGRPGTAKTHTVRAVLEQEIKEIFTYQRGHLTPMGLFELVAAHADEVIVLDDLGAVLKSDVALQILLSALEHPTARDRSRVVNGHAALETVMEFKPDIIVCDIGMPGIDGYETCRRLRQVPGLEKTLIAAVSGYGNEEDRRKSKEAGFDRHLVKPIGRATVEDLVNSAAGI